jgi:hypothetical protein
MDVSFDGDLNSDQELAHTATHARELAQQRIVMAFRAYVHGQGPGPTDSELQIFAKLAVVEHALQGDYLSHMVPYMPSVNAAKASPAI